MEASRLVRGGALAGANVLDLTRGHLGAYAARLLSTLGADVLHVEPPEGDELRRTEPTCVIDGERVSLSHIYYRAGHRSVTLTIEEPDDASLLRRLALDADVLLISGVGHAVLHIPDRIEQLRHDALIVCAITPFGLSGPGRARAATPLTSAALGGVMMGRGDSGAPYAVPGRQEWDEASAHAALLVLAALRQPAPRAPATIDLAVHEVLAAQNHTVQRYALAEIDELPTDASVPPSGTWTCRDGQVDVQVWSPAHWRAFRQLLGDPAGLADAALADPVARTRRAGAIGDIVATALAQWPRDALVAAAQELRVPCTPANSLQEFMDDPQTTARGFFVERDEPRLGVLRAPGPFFSSPQAVAAVHGRSPRLGEDDGVLAAARRAPAEARPGA